MRLSLGENSHCYLLLKVRVNAIHVVLPFSVIHVYRARIIRSISLILQQNKLILIPDNI